MNAPARRRGTLAPGVVDTGGRYSRLLDLDSLGALQRRLSGAPTMEALLSRVAEDGARTCGFERAVVVEITDGRLLAGGMDPVADPACEELRRRSLGISIAMTSASEEAELVRREEGPRAGPAGHSGLLREALDLREHALAALIPESRAVALLVLDRAGPPVGDEDLGAVELFAHLASVAIERVALGLRMSELSEEFQRLTESAESLIKDALEAPVTLATHLPHGQASDAPARRPTAAALTELLSDREREIAALMARGHSNREIGVELHLSADTIKTHIARLVRKLGAANRVEAAVKYAEMSRE